MGLRNVEYIFYIMYIIVASFVVRDKSYVRILYNVIQSKNITENSPTSGKTNNTLKMVEAVKLRINLHINNLITMVSQNVLHEAGSGYNRNVLATLYLDF